MKNVSKKMDELEFLREKVEKLEDLVAQTQAQNDALKKETAFWKSCLGCNPDSVLLLDAQGRLTYVNPSFLNWTGRKTEDLLGRNLSEISPPIIDKKTADIIMQRARERMTCVGQTRVFETDSEMQEVQLEELLDGAVELAFNDYDLKKKHNFQSIAIVMAYLGRINDHWLELMDELKRTEAWRVSPPGLAHRFQIYTAYLLFECTVRLRRQNERTVFPEGDLVALRDLICRLDTGCSFAQKVFVQEL